MSVTYLVGTAKGAFVLRADDARARFDIAGPFFKGWKVTAATRTSKGRTIVATASDVYGAALHVADELRPAGKTDPTFRQVEKGPRYPDGGARKLQQIWRIAEQPGTGRLFAGVADAGLFASDDDGASWEPVRALNEHETAAAWQPGAGGLCAHSLVFDPKDARRIWCGISAVGVFRTDDGGATWTSKNAGVPIILEDEKHHDIGFCVHALVPDPDDARRIYRQDHLGMFRTDDGGDRWERIETGLPSAFGFPLAMDRRSKSLFAFPLQSDEYRVPPEGKLRVYRSKDAGASWQALTNGLPQENAWALVLRRAIACDQRDPGGIVVGTASGTLHASRDLGETWQTIPATLPRVLFVEHLEE